MELPVYDKYTRRYSNALSLLPAVMGLFIVIIIRPGSRLDFIVFAPFGIFAVVMFLLLHLLTNGWVSVDSSRGKITKCHKLFAWPIRSFTYDIKEFDRISIHRVFRGGYRATVLGKDFEVPIAGSSGLAWVREAAQKISSSSGLKINENL